MPLDGAIVNQEQIGESAEARFGQALDRLMPVASMAGIVYFTTVTTAAGRDHLLVVGGLLSTLFLTLLVVPAAYGIIDDIRLWFRKLFRLNRIFLEQESYFNIMGEPIVCRPEEAIECFLNTGIDHLLIGSFHAEKCP